MDIAKALAKIEMAQTLISGHNDFRIYKMIRTGLLSYKTDPYLSKGQLAGSLFYGIYLRPQIIHVVAFCEAIQRATSREIIESVKIAKQVFNIAHKGLPDFASDPEVIERKKRLIEETGILLEAIENLDPTVKEPLTSPELLEEAVLKGILDAPGLSTGPACAKIKTQIVNGANESVDDFGNIISERKRIKALF
jgi:hypothetical protein